MIEIISTVVGFAFFFGAIYAIRKIGGVNEKDAREGSKKEKEILKLVKGNRRGIDRIHDYLAGLEQRRFFDESQIQEDEKLLASSAQNESEETQAGVVAEVSAIDSIKAEEEIEGNIDAELDRDTSTLAEAEFTQEVIDEQLMQENQEFSIVSKEEQELEQLATSLGQLNSISDVDEKVLDFLKGIASSFLQKFYEIINNQKGYSEASKNRISKIRDVFDAIFQTQKESNYILKKLTKNGKNARKIAMKSLNKINRAILLKKAKLAIAKATSGRDKNRNEALIKALEEEINQAEIIRSQVAGLIGNLNGVFSIFSQNLGKIRFSGKKLSNVAKSHKKRIKFLSKREEQVSKGILNLEEPANRIKAQAENSSSTFIYENLNLISSALGEFHDVLVMVFEGDLSFNQELESISKDNSIFLENVRVQIPILKDLTLNLENMKRISAQVVELSSKLFKSAVLTQITQKVNNLLSQEKVYFDGENRIFALIPQIENSQLIASENQLKLFEAIRGELNEKINSTKEEKQKLILYVGRVAQNLSARSKQISSQVVDSTSAVNSQINSTPDSNGNSQNVVAGPGDSSSSAGEIKRAA